MTPTLELKVSEIAKRYLVRLLRQRESIRAALAEVKDGEIAALDDIYRVTHQIAGTAGTFGYEDVGRKAKTINQLISSFEIDPGKWELVRLDLLLIEFDDAVYRVSRPVAHPRTPESKKTTSLLTS